VTVTKDVKKKSGRQSGDPKLGAKIKELRKILGCDQTRFAALIGVSQAIVSQWEVGRYMPSPMAMLAISRMAGSEKNWWLERAGPEFSDAESTLDAYKKLFTVEGDDNRVIHIHGTAGAGPNRFPPEQAESKISLPRQWFKGSQGIVGLRVVGDSMAPLIQEGFLVLLDIHDNKDFRSLEDKIVAARNDNGVVIKWLKRMQNAYFLVSHNLDYAPIEVKKDEYAIVGRVVKWIGQPNAPKRK
jgi:SOS-response transcriptional repressor LexA